MRLSASKIRTLIFLQDKTQTGVAKEAKISRSSITSACNGKSIRYETACAIATALNVDVSELIESKKGITAMMHYSDDPIRDAELTQADQETWLESRPVCDYCDNYVVDDYYFEPEPGLVICDDCIRKYCIDNFMVMVEED